MGPRNAQILTLETRVYVMLHGEGELKVEMELGF